MAKNAGFLRKKGDMQLSSELPFEGFNEYIRKPLEVGDRRSFLLIKKILVEEKECPKEPFSFLIKKLSGNYIPNKEAIICWQRILNHKMSLQQKLGRVVGIQIAALDYFDYIFPENIVFKTTESQSDVYIVKGTQSLIRKEGYQIEKLKEELFRAKRYKHSLSVIMFDVENIKESSFLLTTLKGEKVVEIIVNIVRRAIRNVDYFFRITDYRYCLILPNTNLREAEELSQRLKKRLSERIKRSGILTEELQTKFFVAQCSPDDSASEFLTRLENQLNYQK